MEGKMNDDMGARPLDSFPVIRSHDPEEIREAVKRTYGARNFDFPLRGERLVVRANHWRSRHISLSYWCNEDAPVQFDFPGSTFFRQFICFRSGADIRTARRISMQVTSREHSIVPPETPFDAVCAPGFEELVLRIEADSLATKLGALIGATPSRKLVFDEAAPGRAAAIGNLRRLVSFFAAELDSMSAETPALAIVELEQALIVSFICSNPNNYSHLLDRAPQIATWQVRRAEEYIEAHWNKPITVETLARVTSASARSIFRHFRSSRGVSPLAFVKQLRLQRAKEMLERAELNPSVTETAVACGFSNFGHFASDYFKRFGERPSETIKRLKGNLPPID
jgi:AraC-like DNA-binding protein